MIQQIYTDRFLALSDYIWDSHNEWYALNRAQEFDLPIVRRTQDFGESGIVFCGPTQDINLCLDAIPKTGKYIIIARDCDFHLTEEVYRRKPDSVKHWFCRNLAVYDSGVTATPIGINTINGPSPMLIELTKEDAIPVEKRIFCRFNVNSETHDRNLALGNVNPSLQYVVTDQMTARDFYINILSHEFTLSPAGLGMDCLRTWEALALGSIPIVSDCPEMRHFEDMPLVYAPKDFVFTNEWLDEQKPKLAGKSLTRSKFTYWQRLIYAYKSQLL